MVHKPVVFTGRYLDAMVALLAPREDRVPRVFVPVNARWELERFVGVVGTPEEGAVVGTYRDTGTGLVRLVGGGVKVVQDSAALRAVKPDMALVNYGIGGVDDPAPEVVEISASVVARDFNRHLKTGEVPYNAGWLALSSPNGDPQYGDQGLLREFEHATRSLRAQRGVSAYDAPAMRISVLDAVKGLNVERPVVLWSFDGYDRGGASDDDLNDRARLAGVAPEALVVAPRSGAAPDLANGVNALYTRLTQLGHTTPITKSVLREGLAAAGYK